MIKLEKLIIIFGMLFVLCGCTVDYTVTISDSNIKESIYVVDTILDNRNEIDINNFYNLWYPVYIEDMIIEDYDEKYDDVEYYNKIEINMIANGFIYSYFNHNIDDYIKSTVWSYAFDNKSIINNNKRMLISTSKGINFFDDNPIITSIKVNIITDYVVVDSNADIINDNIYTWEFTKDNYMNKNIYIDIDKTNNDDNNENNNEGIISNPEDELTDNEKDYSWYYIGGGLVLFIIVLIIMFKLKKYFR